MAWSEKAALRRMAVAVVRQLDVLWLALAASTVVGVVVTIVILVIGLPSGAAAGAAAGAYGCGLTVVLLFLYLAELAGKLFGWRFLQLDRARLPRWFRSPVLPFATVVLGLLFGHFIW